MNQRISVVIPIFKIPENFSKIQRQIYHATTPIEVIYVLNEEIDETLTTQNSYEHVICRKNEGRGYMMKEGVQQSQGDIIVLLHADTILPDGWDTSILEVMGNQGSIGGGFSLTFDIDHVYLKTMMIYVKYMVLLTKVLSGDRAIFVRSEPLKKNISLLETPIMEDIALSLWMKTQGKVHLLEKTVITSADAFVKNGYLRQSYKIFKSLAWFKLTGNTRLIYKYYYER